MEYFIRIDKKYARRNSYHEAAMKEIEALAHYTTQGHFALVGHIQKRLDELHKAYPRCNRLCVSLAPYDWPKGATAPNACSINVGDLARLELLRIAGRIEEGGEG